MAKFYLLIGPSGVGKSKLQEKLVSGSGLNHIVRSISATTRQKRIWERDGLDYFFFDDVTFFDMVDNEKFLEYNNYSTGHYGTPKQFIEENLGQGNDIVGVVEIKGATDIISKYDQMSRRDRIVSIFVYPEHFRDLVTRLEERDIKPSFSPSDLQKAKKDIKKRITVAREEISALNTFDYLICMRHNCFDEAYAQVYSIIVAERAREKVTPDYFSRFVRAWTSFQKSYNH